MKIKVGIIFGGMSTEHEVSIISALQACNAFDKEKYEIVPIYITKDNKMFTGEDLLEISNYKNMDSLLERCDSITFSKNNNVLELIRYPKRFLATNVANYIDVAFPIVHGTNTEDGTIQGFLNTFDIPYVGCDVLSSALGMDKYIMKVILKDAGVNVLPADVFDIYEDIDEIVFKIEKKYTYPVIIKPVNLGSSIGISIAKNKDKLYKAIEDSFKYSRRILVERAVKNIREINISVLGDSQEAITSACEEPLTSDELLTYDNKYVGKNSKTGASKGMASLGRILPADISKEEEKTIKTMALKTFKALGCNGVSRIDMIIDKDTKEIFVNEINTIPGSLSFYLWKESGIKYEELLDRLVKLSLKRNREREKLTFSFNTNILSNANIGSKGSKGVKKF